jgi:hypothetical protein
MHVKKGCVGAGASVKAFPTSHPTAVRLSAAVSAQHVVVALVVPCMGLGNSDGFSMLFAAVACSSGFLHNFASQQVNFMNVSPCK